MKLPPFLAGWLFYDKSSSWLVSLLVQHELLFIIELAPELLSLELVMPS